AAPGPGRCPGRDGPRSPWPARRYRSGPGPSLPPPATGFAIRSGPSARGAAPSESSPRPWEQGRNLGLVLLVRRPAVPAQGAFFLVQLDDESGDAQAQPQETRHRISAEGSARKGGEETGVDRMAGQGVGPGADQGMVRLQRHRAAPKAPEMDPGPDGETQS